MKTKCFKDLIVWQKSYALALVIYRVTGGFPKSETYGLSQQMRKAATSIPSNIAEGYGRQHKAEYDQFMYTAYGSLLVLVNQFLLASDLEYITENPQIEELLREVGSMLYRMLHPINAKR